MLAILSAINFGLVGCLYGLVGLVKIITAGAAGATGSQIKQYVGSEMATLKILT